MNTLLPPNSPRHNQVEKDRCQEEMGIVQVGRSTEFEMNAVPVHDFCKVFDLICYP